MRESSSVEELRTMPRGEGQKGVRPSRRWMYARGSAIGEVLIILAMRTPRTQSGIMTARRSSCTDIPLDFASPNKTWKVSSVTDAMNFAMGEFSLAGILLTIS